RASPCSASRTSRSTERCGRGVRAGPCCSSLSGSCSSGGPRRGTVVRKAVEEIDFAIDPEGLPERADLGAVGGEPSVVVHDLHVTYRVFGSRRRPAPVHKQSGLRRLLSKSSTYAGAVTEVRAVRGVSFVAHHGESIGIIG